MSLKPETAIKLIREYRNALLWEYQTSSGNNCLDAARAEYAAEIAEKALLEALT